MRFLLTSSRGGHNSQSCGLDDSVIESMIKYNEQASHKVSLFACKLDKFHGFRKQGGFDCALTDINSIEDLERLQKAVGHPLIVDFEGYDDTPEIEVYNDYRE